mgnify:CR=1 FL=1
MSECTHDCSTCGNSDCSSRQGGGIQKEQLKPGARVGKVIAVMSGKGGDTILRICNEILADEYPELYAKCSVTLPDEKMRRVGQSVAAASLPQI